MLSQLQKSGTIQLVLEWIWKGTNLQKKKKMTLLGHEYGKGKDKIRKLAV